MGSEQAEVIEVVISPKIVRDLDDLPDYIEKPIDIIEENFPQYQQQAAIV